MQQLALGRTYRLTFKPEFISHGYQTPVEGVTPTYLHQGKGVATLAAIFSFVDLVKAGIQLYTNFFKPCGLTEDEYRAYYDGKPADILEVVEEDVVIVAGKTYSSVNYANFPVYKFVDAVNPDDVFYVPQESLAAFPEVDIGTYYKLMMTVDLGVQKDVTQTQHIKDAIAQQLNLFGISTADVDLMVYDTVFMTTDEYETLDAARQPEGSVSVTLTSEVIDQYVDLYLVLGQDGTMTKLTASNKATYLDQTVNLVSLSSSFSTNYFLRWKLAEQELDQKNARIAALEELVIDLTDRLNQP